MSKDSTRLSIDVPKSYHKALKLYALKRDITIKDFFIDLLEKNMPKEVEDYIVGKMALASKEVGSLGLEGSQEFLKKLKKRQKIKKTKCA